MSARPTLYGWYDPKSTRAFEYRRDDGSPVKVTRVSFDQWLPPRDRRRLVPVGPVQEGGVVRAIDRSI